MIETLMLRSTKIRYYVAAMQARGFTAVQVLSGVGISLPQLDDPTLLVNRQQCQQVILNMIRLTGNPGLGFDIGQSEQLVDFGIVAHAMMSSRTLRQACDLWVRFSNLVGMMIRLSIEDRPEGWLITYNTIDLDRTSQNFCIEEILMSGIKMAETLTYKALDIKECTLAYSAPAHQAQYQKFIPCLVRFDAPTTSILIRTPQLDTPLRGNDPEFNEICLRHCGQMLRQIASRSSNVARLRSLFLGQPRMLPSLEEAAGYLGMSPRSLRRYLLEEGVSYQKLVDEFRFDLAREYLTAEHLTQKEVAYFLGFSNASAFRRAFKLWSGCTISQFLDDAGKHLNSQSLPSVRDENREMQKL